MNTFNISESSPSALIAMSGGVDSSVAACLMKEVGYRCAGATMKLFANDDIGISRGHTCCSLDDVLDAKNVARALRMAHYTFNFSERFEEDVIKPFADSYAFGLTPNPCIDCNRYLKFDKLFQRARELDFDYVVTGHYARISYDEKSGRHLLMRAVDYEKDQSYVLYSLTQEQLAHTLFPLGELRKAETRAIAAEHGFINAQKAESQDICFVQDGDYASFIEEFRGEPFASGNFISLSGEVLGRHRGIIHYTIGQRKGLGIADRRPLYVVAIDPRNNTVMLGYDEDLFTDTLLADDVNLIAVERLDGPTRIQAKVRYRQEAQDAVVEPVDGTSVKVVFDDPQRAIAPGQAVVFYDGDRVVGGATILPSPPGKKQ